MLFAWTGFAQPLISSFIFCGDNISELIIKKHTSRIVLFTGFTANFQSRGGPNICAGAERVPCEKLAPVWTLCNGKMGPGTLEYARLFDGLACREEKLRGGFGGGGSAVSPTPRSTVCRGAGETAAEHFGEGAAATESAMPVPYEGQAREGRGGPGGGALGRGA